MSSAKFLYSLVYYKKLVYATSKCSPHKVLKSHRSETGVIYICNHEIDVPSQLSSQWLCGNSCTLTHGVHLGCAQVHELLQSRCRDKRKGTSISWLRIYCFYGYTLFSLLSTWSFEHSGDISCSLLVNPTHTDESWAGQNMCM